MEVSLIQILLILEWCLVNFIQGNLTILLYFSLTLFKVTQVTKKFPKYFSNFIIMNIIINTKFQNLLNRTFIEH